MTMMKRLVSFRNAVRIAILAVLVALPAAALAQYGHPMKGQWSGQWGKDNQRLLLDLDWDGKNVIGTINPGPNSAALKTVDINYANAAAGKWNVKMTADGKDASGKTTTIQVDGVLENIGSSYRAFHGTWTQNGVKGEFTVTRN
jgi:hypothetical protein